MADLTKLTLSKARDGFQKGDFTSSELVEAHIDMITANEDLNCYITTTFDLARQQAKNSDEKKAKGETLRPLEGLPLGIKDIFCTKDVRTTAASRMLENFIPPYESTVTKNLWHDGAVMLGKLNLDEFAMGSANLNSAFGPVISPWRRHKDPEQPLVPGGSSGGSAAAVAGGLCLGATGTDTGGSIRQPAAWTGIVGLKPTYGRCSRWGTIAFASSLDQAGPMTKTVRDSAIMLQSMAGFDPLDSTSARQEVPHYEATLNQGIKGLRIGIPADYKIKNMPPEIEALWQKGIEWLKQAGATIVSVCLPHTKMALPAYYIVAPAEASSNLARYDGVRYGARIPGDSLDEMYELTRAQGFGPEVKRRILLGTHTLSSGYYDAYYLKAQKVRTLINEDFQKAWNTVDIILTPTTPCAAFGLHQESLDPTSMYLNDIFTVPANMAGLPAISLPAGLDDQGLPLGLQLVGPAFDEQTILRTAYALEQAAQFTASPTGLKTPGLKTTGKGH